MEDSVCERRELSKPCRSQWSTYKCPQSGDSVVCCMNVLSVALFSNIPVGYKHDLCSHAATVCAFNYLKPFSWTPEDKWQPLKPKGFPHLPALQCSVQQSYKSREIYHCELVPLAFTKAGKSLLADPLLIIALARAEPIF